MSLPSCLHLFLQLLVISHHVGQLGVGFLRLQLLSADRLRALQCLLTVHVGTLDQRLEVVICGVEFERDGCNITGDMLLMQLRLQHIRNSCLRCVGPSVLLSALAASSAAPRWPPNSSWSARGCRRSRVIVSGIPTWWRRRRRRRGSRPSAFILSLRQKAPALLRRPRVLRRLPPTAATCSAATAAPCTCVTCAREVRRSPSCDQMAAFIDDCHCRLCLVWPNNILRVHLVITCLAQLLVYFGAGRRLLPACGSCACSLHGREQHRSAAAGSGG